tara:strand:+ start:29 stop:541 length:513 start_codon:yes stop_codon:yes gene_type:complete
MAYGNQVKTDSITTTYTDEVYPLGSIYVESADEVVAATDGTTSLGLQGDRTWMFVRAGVAVNAYDACVINAIATPLVVRPTNASGSASYLFVGVAQNAIALNSYGWIVIRGECAVKGAASITAGQLLDTNGGAVAGQLDDDTTLVQLVGRALTGTNTPITGTVAARIPLL